MREVFRPDSGKLKKIVPLLLILKNMVDTDYMGMMRGEDEGSFRTR